MNSYTGEPYAKNYNAMAPDFGEVYDRDDFTKMFPMGHETEKKIIWSCAPSIQLSRGLQSFKNYLKTA